MLITIYDRTGNLKAEVSPSDSSTQVKEIQGDNVLTLSFTHHEHIALDVDDYCDYEGERYWLTEAYRPEQKSTLEWAYDIKLYGIESMIKNMLVLKRVDGDNDPVFTLTAPPREHVAMIVNCMNDGAGHITDWKAGQVDGTENIVIDYHGKYCDEALREIAEKVGAEWWVEGQTVNVCRCQHGEQIALGYDKGLTGITPDKADNVKFYTRLFPVGSSRNIDPEKYGHSRLQLPGGKKYVEVNADRYGRVDHYEDSAFAGIYPRRTGEVSSVRSEEKTGEDGKPFTIYYFTDNNLPFDPNDYEIGGLVKRVSFQEGSELGGLGDEDNGTYYFEANFNSDTREFEIITIWPYGDDMQLPGGTLIPKAGDRYILWNIRMPDEYYALAEDEFLAAVNRYNEEHAIDVAVFKCPTDHTWIEENGADLFVGRRVRLESEQYFPETGYRDSRITKITRRVNLPSSMDIEIGDALSRTAMQKMSDSISDTRSYVKSIGESVALPDIIRTGDNTRWTDNNLLSALRSAAEFVSKKLDDVVQGLIRFVKGIRIGNYVKGYSGASIDAAGNAEVESLESRSWLKVQELIYNRLNAQEGDTSFSDSGTIEEITNNADGTQTALMRLRWDGDFTAFQPGDVVYGYVNNLDRADAKEWYKAWAWIKSVDRKANALALVRYPDSEVPSGKNHAMAAGMNIARWGNNIEPTQQAYLNPEYSAVIVKRADGTYANVRQQSFFVSCDSGNIVELMGVNKPKLEPGNYGTVLGAIPDGLLDPKTEELINKDQPYLFARGIIVQDLIRIGYEGVQTRTANYRGIWDSATAASPTGYYRSTASVYDTVTWHGSLWQCVVSQNADEPSDANGAWVKMTASPEDGKEVRLWLLNPSANIVSVRRTEVRPEVLTCGVTLCSSNNATRTFDNNYDLLLAGAKLFYSADGLYFEEFIIGGTEPLDLEDDSGVIELENSEDNSNILTVGGNDIPTAEIGDRIIFSLRDADTGEELAQCHVPVVKDGLRAPFQSTVFLRTNSAPEKPAGGTYDSPLPTSAPAWSDSIPEGEEILWATTRTFGDGMLTYWEEPRQMTDTATYDVEFSDTDLDPGTPSTKPTLWFDPDKDKATKDFTKMLWRAERQKKNGTWSDWTIVRIKGEHGEKGDKGDSGDYVSHVFKQSSTKPAAPTDMEHSIPTGWQDAPSSTGKWWMSKATIDGVTGKPKGSWSAPVQVTAEDGAPGTHGGYNDFKYAKAKEGATPALTASQASTRHPNGWTDNPPSLTVGEALWMIQAEIDGNDALVGTWSTPVRISGEKGDKGDQGDKGDKGDPGSDGKDGMAGRDGLMVYPAGYYDENTTYTADNETAPVVMYAENYYVLRRGSTYKGASQAENRNTPAKEVANAPVQNGESTSRWQLFDKFNAIFADIIMAEFAKLASAVFYGDWMISQQGTLTYTKEYRYKVAGNTPTLSEADLKSATPSGWSTTFPTSVPNGSSIYYISANKHADGTLVEEQTWSSPATTKYEMQNEEISTVDSRKYQDFKHGSFEPNYSVNFKTGEINAGSGVFAGSLLTLFKHLNESDATQKKLSDSNGYSYYGYVLNNDLKIIAGTDTIVLPAAIKYAGTRAMICNTVKYYSRTDKTSKIRVENNGCIYGLQTPDNILPSSGAYTAKCITFLTGVIELVAVPNEAGEACDWFVISNNAHYCDYL